MRVCLSALELCRVQSCDRTRAVGKSACHCGGEIGDPACIQYQPTPTPRIHLPPETEPVLRAISCPYKDGQCYDYGYYTAFPIPLAKHAPATRIAINFPVSVKRPEGRDSEAYTQRLPSRIRTSTHLLSPAVVIMCAEVRRISRASTYNPYNAPAST